MAHSRDDAPRDVRRLVDASSLPERARERILEIASSRRLTAMEQIDVARELIAHFEDGLAAGHSLEELLERFGDETAAADLVGRAKRTAKLRSRTAEHVGASGDSIVFVIGRDLRHAFRRLTQSPGFTLVAILSLALGIGANTAIFSVVNTLLLKGLPVTEPDRLVAIYESSPEFPYNAFSWPDFQDFRERMEGTFESYAVASITLAPLEEEDGVTSLVGELVNGNYFPTLGLEPAVGRLLGPADDQVRGGHPVVVLGYDVWQQRFDGDPGVVGREIRLAGTPFTVVGVAPDEWQGNLNAVDPGVYIPVTMTDVIESTPRSKLDERGFMTFFVKGRLAPGVSLEQARAAAEPIAREMRETYPGNWEEGEGFRFLPAEDVVVFPTYDGAIRVGGWLLLAVVGMVLLLACANLAGFLLARAVDRRKEIAVRLALGATRGKLIGQLLTETVLLALLGGGAGVAGATVFLGWLRTADVPFPVPLTFDFGIDPTVLAFAGAVSLLAGVVFGLIPAFRATRPDITGTLRDEAPGAGQGSRTVARSALVVGQVAVSVVLLVVAGLLLRSVQAVYGMDPGFGREPAAIASFTVPMTRMTDEEAIQMYAELRREIASMPTVEAVGGTSNLHLNPVNTLIFPIEVDGVPPPPGAEEHRVDFAAATPGYFEAAGIPVIEGRGFQPDDDPEGRPVAVVSQALARTFFPDGAVGATLRSRDEEITVIGVTADTKVRSLGEAPRPFLYRPVAQSLPTGVSMVATTRGNPRAMLPVLAERIRDLAPDVVVYETKTMDDHLEMVRFPTRLSAVAFGLFATLALALAAIGLYGLMSYTQAQRAHEVGIRLSLGAEPGSVVRLMIRSGLKLVTIGGAVGLLAAVALSRIASALLFGISPWDPTTFAAVILVLGSVAFLAAWIPARRASRIDPVEALRAE